MNSPPDLHGACIALTCRMRDYQLGVLVGCRTPHMRFMPSCLQLPGGKFSIETEGSAEACARELQEETNYIVNRASLFKLGEKKDVPFLEGIKYHLHMFHFHHCGANDDFMNIIENREPEKNMYWQLMPVRDLLVNRPANVLPGFYESLVQL